MLTPDSASDADGISPRSLPSGFTVRNIAGTELTAHEEVIDEFSGIIHSHGSLYDWAAEHPQRRALRGRAPVYVAELGSGVLVAVRHVWHGGMLSPLTGDRFLRPARARTELGKSLILLEKGIPTAQILGFALYQAGPGLVRVDVVTRYIEGACDFEAVLSGLAPDTDPATATSAVRELVRSLARNRLVHKDLNIKNILIKADARSPLGARAYVIDVDTMAFRPGLSEREAMNANVKRLQRSIRKWRDSRESPAEAADVARTALEGVSVPALTLGIPRFCIVMMSAVGDAVHVMPLVNAIKKWNPDSHITWILQPGPASLVGGHPHVDEIIVFDRSKGWRAFTEIRNDLGKREFDVVLALQVYFKAGIVTSFTHAPLKLGFDHSRARDLNWLFTTHRIPRRAGQHVQDQYFEFLDELGIPHGDPEWGLGPWNQEECHWQRAFVQQFERPTAAVVVATSKKEKDWLPERWAEVCLRLHDDHGLQPVLVGGMSDRERKAAEIIRARVPVAHSALGSGLRRLAAIIDASALTLSPDTGPLHLAVALRAPVIALMGYTNPKRVGPYDFARDLMIDAYGDPGEDYPLDMSYRQNRMQRISTDDVMTRVGLWQERYREARFASLRERGLLVE